MKSLFMFITIVLLASSCASQKKQSQEPSVNMHTVKTKIKKGITTKAQVIEILGSPEMVNTEGSGKEQWVYSEYNSESNTNDNSVSGGVFDYFTERFVGVDLGVSKSSSNHTAKSKRQTLWVYFNPQGKVSSYNYSTDKTVY